MGENKMTILDTYSETMSGDKSDQHFSKNSMISDKVSDDKALSFKQDICTLEDGVRLLKEGDKIYIFRYG